MATRYHLGCTLGLALSGVALQALAEPPAASTNNNGLMSFPNVSVINAPTDASKHGSAAQGAAAASGMKAYLDPASGELTQVTAENAAQLSNAARPRTAVAAKNIGTAATANSGVQVLRRADNSLMVLPTEETMVFQVAHKDANGKVSQQCVSGEDSATHALHAKPAPVAAKESRNDR